MERQIVIKNLPEALQVVKEMKLDQMSGRVSTGMQRGVLSLRC